MPQINAPLCYASCCDDPHRCGLAGHCSFGHAGWHRQRAGPGGERLWRGPHPHHAYLFTNKRANRIKVLVHDGIGIWLAARRLHQGKFVWPASGSANVGLAHAQLDALVLGLPWSRIGEGGIINVV